MVTSIACCSTFHLIAVKKYSISALWWSISYHINLQKSGTAALSAYITAAVDGKEDEPEISDASESEADEDITGIQDTALPDAPPQGRSSSRRRIEPAARGLQDEKGEDNFSCFASIFEL